MALPAMEQKPSLVSSNRGLAIAHRVQILEERFDAMAEDIAKIAQFIDGVDNVKKLVNKWGVVLLTSAVTAGLVNGRVGEFLAALLKNLPT